MRTARFNAANVPGAAAFLTGLISLSNSLPIHSHSTISNRVYSKLLFVKRVFSDFARVNVDSTLRDDCVKALVRAALA